MWGGKALYAAWKLMVSSSSIFFLMAYDAMLIQLLNVEARQKGGLSYGGQATTLTYHTLFFGTLL